MGIVRVQFQRQLLDAPPVGKWSVYSTAWFDATVEDPTIGVRNLLERLFNAQQATGGDNPVIMTSPFSTAPGGCNFTTWSWFSGTLTKVSTHSHTLTSRIAGSPVYFPSQAQVALGYKADVEGPVQRGRSRFFLGPLVTATIYCTQTASGGIRLNKTGVDKVVSNVVSTLAALKAEGWTLQVKSGSSLLSSFSPAVEVYCDDVIDVMRSRRSWQTYQKRTAI